MKISGLRERIRITREAETKRSPAGFPIASEPVLVRSCWASLRIQTGGEVADGTVEVPVTATFAIRTRQPFEVAPGMLIEHRSGVYRVVAADVNQTKGLTYITAVRKEREGAWRTNTRA